MATYRFGRLLLLAILALCVGPAVIAAQATTYTETFDGPLNPAIWTSSSSNGASVEVVGGELVVAIPTHSSSVDPGAGIQSTFDAGGAFTLEVDYHVVIWPADQGNSAGLYVLNGNSMRMARGQVGYYAAGWHFAEQYYSVINGGGPYVSATTGDTSGKLLISRSSDFWVATKYWNGSSWTQVGPSVRMYDDGKLTLSAWGSDTAAMEVHFDNFKVTSDNLPAVPLPPTALLLGSGLLGLGLTGWRRRRRRA